MFKFIAAFVIFGIVWFVVSFLRDLDDELRKCGDCELGDLTKGIACDTCKHKPGDDKK